MAGAMGYKGLWVMRGMGYEGFDCTLPLLKFVHATGRFKALFGKDASECIQTNSKKKAEICLATEQLETALINAANTSTN
jgi:hypothetical protein